MSLLAPGGIAQRHVCQMINMVQCFEIKFSKRRQKVLFFFFFVFVFHAEFSCTVEGGMISGGQRNQFSENKNPAGLSLALGRNQFSSQSHRRLVEAVNEAQGWGG